jgi:hypothetical protein
MKATGSEVNLPGGKTQMPSEDNDPLPGHITSPGGT